MVLEIQLFFLIPSSKASCFVEASHLVEDVQKNGYISRTTECINTVVEHEMEQLQDTSNENRLLAVVECWLSGGHATGLETILEESDFDIG